ncbi:DUF1289 domain-containing protein [Sulfuritalea sp.]|uniref:DUF1289 domain-containing protein n=1 Tax=Sulfuritalea sp. TaxID=2480090 RepID=UPI00286DD56E|nr:DUF1289 domain-containing protein [Sulfuritalea sp.]
MNNFIAPPPVRSPCVEVCELDPEKGLCRGSYRTQDERDWWVAYSNVQQRDVQQRCEQRRAVSASRRPTWASSSRATGNRPGAKTSEKQKRPPSLGAV